MKEPGAQLYMNTQVPRTDLNPIEQVLRELIEDPSKGRTAQGTLRANVHTKQYGSSDCVAVTLFHCLPSAHDVVGAKLVELLVGKHGIRTVTVQHQEREREAFSHSLAADPVPA